MESKKLGELDDESVGMRIVGFDLQARVRAIPEEDHETLGRMVRDVWITWALEQPNPKPSWLVPWEQLPATDREVDIRIGRRLANFGRLTYVDVPTHDYIADKDAEIAKLRAEISRLRRSAEGGK